MIPPVAGFVGTSLGAEPSAALCWVAVVEVAIAVAGLLDTGVVKRDVADVRVEVGLTGSEVLPLVSGASGGDPPSSGGLPVVSLSAGGRVVDVPAVLDAGLVVFVEGTTLVVVGTTTGALGVVLGVTAGVAVDVEGSTAVVWGAGAVVVVGAVVTGTGAGTGAGPAFAAIWKDRDQAGSFAGVVGGVSCRPAGRKLSSGPLR